MTTPGFHPSHVVPQDGLPAWEIPDPSRPTVPLDALLPVQLVDRRGDWGRVVCANGWSAWVDGRLLVAVPQDPPAASGPPAGTADPRPLLARAAQALARYREAADGLAGGALDGESFHDHTRELRVGVVVDGEAAWLYDTRHERWEYCDGARLSTYAAPAKPSTAAPEPGGDVREPGPGEPTRLVRDPAPGDGEQAPARPQSPVPDGGHEPTRIVSRPPDDRPGDP